VADAHSDGILLEQKIKQEKVLGYLSSQCQKIDDYGSSVPGTIIFGNILGKIMRSRSGKITSR